MEVQQILIDVNMFTILTFKNLPQMVLRVVVEHLLGQLLQESLAMFAVNRNPDFHQNCLKTRLKLRSHLFKSYSVLENHQLILDTPINEWFSRQQNSM